MLMHLREKEEEVQVCATPDKGVSILWPEHAAPQRASKQLQAVLAD